MKKLQAFLVIGFVVTLTLSIGLYLQKETEKDKRVAIERTFNSIMEANKRLEASLNKKIDMALATIKEKDALIKNMSGQLWKEKIIRSKLTQNFERTHARFKSIASAKKAVELEKIVVSALTDVEGKVLAIDKQNDLVVVSLGAINNLKSGDMLSIYRGKDFIANAQLVKVQERISAAMVLDRAKNSEVQIDDTVK